MAFVTLFFNLPFFSIVKIIVIQFSKTKLGIENMYNDISICFIIRFIPEFHRCKFRSNLVAIAPLKNRSRFPSKRDYPEYPTMRVNNRKRVGGVERNSEISGSNELSRGISFAFYHFCCRPSLPLLSVEKSRRA